MRRLIASILLLALVAVPASISVAGGLLGSLPRAGLVVNDLAVEFCASPGCTYGTDLENYASAGVRGRCAARVRISALTGGNIDSRVETSSDAVHWYTLNAFSNCAAAPCTGVYWGTTQTLRYARLVVVANGTPSLATADIALECLP